jgi:hypothetical protein
MDEAPDQTTGESPYLKLPWPLVAGGLAIMLLVVLGVGLYANRYLRPQTTIQPTFTAVAVVVPLATPQPATPTAAPATSTPQPAIAPVTATQTPILRSTAGPTPAAAQATSTAVPETSSTPSPEPTVDPALAAEVGRAYENYWRVQTDAILQLDTSQLASVMDGEALDVVTRRIEELRAEGKAIRTKAVLNYNVVQADDSKAAVVDRVEDNSFYVKAGTEEPVSEPASGAYSVLFHLQKISGMWKVVDSVVPT